MFTIELGQVVKDKITGFKGVIIGRCEHIFGCNTYGVVQQSLVDGKRGEPEWFDEGRLKILYKEKRINPKKVQVEKPGCEKREHPKVK